jgi:hypothetical protein
MLPALSALAPCDVAIRARPNAYDVALNDLRDDIRLVVRRAQTAADR